MSKSMTNASPIEAGSKRQDTQLLAFRLGEQEYALSISNVVQVVRMVAITPLPTASDELEGVINLHGKIIPVVDLRKRCGLPPQPHDLDTQLLIAQSNEQLAALAVDEVSEVLVLSSASIESIDAMSDDLKFLSAIGKVNDRLILILDPTQVIPSAEDLVPKNLN